MRRATLGSASGRELLCLDIDAERFWSKTAPPDMATGCRMWLAHRSPAGYGGFRVGKSNHLAHRVAWALAHGIAPEGALVCHRCDRPPCVEPTHLFIATPAGNTADAMEKGRFQNIPVLYAPGQQNPMAKLTNTQASEIVRRYAYGESGRSLARRYGVCPGSISQIVNGKRRGLHPAYRGALPTRRVATLLGVSKGWIYKMLALGLAPRKGRQRDNRYTHEEIQHLRVLKDEQQRLGARFRVSTGGA